MNVRLPEAAVRTAKVLSVSVPRDLQREISKMAEEERRSVSEVLREAFRQYAAGRALSEVRGRARKSARGRRIRPGRIEALLDESRK